MKKPFFAILLLVLISCSSSDENNEPSFDINLLYGQWFRVGLCDEQNSLLLNQDFTFTKNKSGNIDCNVNEVDTYQYTGNFSVTNDDISFNQLTEEVIIEGTSISVNEFELLGIVR